MADADAIDELSHALVDEYVAAGRTFAAAESCTGGWIAKSVTDIPGASRCFAYGIVSYSNGAKESLLGVSTRTLQAFGAVSEETVREMADGVLRLSGADCAVAISGIAGPDGGSPEKPVGTVWFGWAKRAGARSDLQARRYVIDGDRTGIRARSVIIALQGLRDLLQENEGATLT